MLGEEEERYSESEYDIAAHSVKENLYAKLTICGGPIPLWRLRF